jgi:formylglycine-generating enzyme required for sulfatase activity
LNLELRPVSEKNDKTWPWTFYGTGKFQIQYRQVGGNIGAGQITLDPILNRLATGKLEVEINEKKVEAPAKDPPKNLTNSLGMKFVWIPPGTFKMGSPKEEKERDPGETQHKVTLTKGFYMGVYTVTQEQWQEVMGSNPSKNKGEKNLPVDNVSWNDCQEFIKTLREKDKKPYRLPTEAEWEYACRAGTTTPFHFGEKISTDRANYNGIEAYGENAKGEHRGKTTPVGTFPANAWGLHDMHGNVYQWCQDWFAEYSQKDVVDPQGPDTAKTRRVLRGGSFDDRPERCRSAYRYDGYGPDVPCPFYGFRICFFAE